MFRGKESSNRIELSRLVQDLLNFGVSGSLRLWGWGGGWMGMGVGWGCPPHMCTHMHAHARVLNMIISCKWPPPLGNTWEFPMMSYMHACMCMHVYVCVGHPLTTPHPHPPPHPLGGWTPGISQNSIALELIEIFQFRLKIWNLWRLPHPWVGGWVDGWDQDNSILFEDLWFVETPSPMGGCVGGWVGQWVNGWG